MNIPKKILVFTAVLASFISTNSYAQVRNVNTNISGAVDAFGKPTQTLSMLFPGFSVIRVTAPTITISNIIIDASNQTTGIEINNQANIVIDNVVVKNANGNGILATLTTNLVIKNSEITNNCKSQDISTTTWVGIKDGYGVYLNNGASFSFAGIHVTGGQDMTIDNNTVHNNFGHGIKFLGLNIDGNSDGYSGIIKRNTVGVNALGQVSGNLADGIQLTNSNKVLIDGNLSSANGNRRLWDLAPGNIATDQNSGLDNENFYGSGIELKTSNFNTIINNFVGTNATGTSLVDNVGGLLGNHKHGIYVRNGSKNNIIGLPGKGNIVGGNGFAFANVHTIDSKPDATPPRYSFGVGHGIVLHDDKGLTSNNIVQSNFVGFYNGNCLGNNQDGISLLGFNDPTSPNSLIDNTIGGLLPGEGNIIAGGKFGIFAQGESAGPNKILGNFIGAQDANLASLNCSPADGGIMLLNGAENFTIKGNTIANIAGGAAISIKDPLSVSNNILSNTMSCNSSGIDLVDNGNISFGNGPTKFVAVNTAESNKNTITGVSPNTGDSIDVYLVDNKCSFSTPPCQAPGGNSNNAQGFKLITSFKSVSNTFLATRLEQGYFSFDLTSPLAITNGLTLNNVIFAARDAKLNTSEFHTCINVPLCKPPATVSAVANDQNLCASEKATITTTFTKVVGDISLNSDFRFILFSMLPSKTQLFENTTGTFTNLESGTYTVSVYNMKDKAKCEKSSINVVINSQPIVPSVVISQVTSGKLCAGQTNVQFSVTGQVGSTYIWTSTHDATWSATGTTATIATVSSNFVVSVIETTASPFSCPQQPVNLPVIVNALPVNETITGDVDVCEDETVVYSVPRRAGHSYAWSVTAPDAVLTSTIGNRATIKWGVSSGNIGLTITNPNGCKITNTSTAVAVNLLPNAKTIVGSTPVCAGSTQTYSVTNTTGSTFKWIQDATVLASITNQVTITIPETASTVLKLIETSSKGCVGYNTSDLTVQINKRPIPINLIATPSTQVCLNDLYSVSVDAETGVNFTWSSVPSTMISTVSSLNKLDLVGVASGIITVSATNTTTRCSSNPTELKSIAITVNSLPLKPILLGKNSISCSATEVYSVQTPNPKSKYIWSYGQEAIGVPLEGVLSTSSSATVDFGPRRAEVEVLEINEFGCTSELSNITPVMNGCRPRADFKIDKPNYCFGEVVKITEFATYTPPSIEPLTMKLFFVGAIETELDILPGGTVNVNYLAPGTYKIKMVVTQAGFTDTKDSLAVVTIKPLADISSKNLIGNSSICQNFEGTYTINAPNSGSVYTWQFPGASELSGSSEISKNLKFGPSNADVTITIFENRNGCLDVLRVPIDVLPTPSKIKIDGLKTACENQEFLLKLTGAPTTSTYVWSPSANIVSTNVSKTEVSFKFATEGDYQIAVLETSASGCFNVDSTSFATVTIKGTPLVSNIEGLGLNGVCLGNNAVFTSPLVSGYTYNWIVNAPDVILSTNNNEVSVRPIGEGTKTIALTVTKDGCLSNQTSKNYEVQSIPQAPTVIANGPSYCQGTEADFSILNPKATSEYCWTIPSGTSLVSSRLCGISNDKIKLNIGAFNGDVTVTEKTSIGCLSGTSIPKQIIVQKLLGNTNVTTFKKGGICSGISSDSLAVYEIEFENATSVSYNISPSIPASNFVEERISGTKATLKIVFPESSENINYVIAANAEAGVCDADIVKWDVSVNSSIENDVSIKNEPVCEGSDVKYLVNTTTNQDLTAKYYWFLNDKFIGEGKEKLVLNVDDKDILKVNYLPTKGFCLNLGKSNVDTIISINAFESPKVDITMADETVLKEDFSVFNERYYVAKNKVDFKLLANLTIETIPNAVYDYEFYWENGQSNSKSEISLPLGKFSNSKEAISNASLSDLQNGQLERWYGVKTTVNGICPSTSRVKVVIDYNTFIPNVLNPTCNCPDAVWKIDNIEQFPGNTVIIYNRWGSIVKTYKSGEFVLWDGKGDNGQDLPVSTYFYTVDLKNGNPVQKGPITLLR